MDLEKGIARVEELFEIETDVARRKSEPTLMRGGKFSVNKLQLEEMFKCEPLSIRELPEIHKVAMAHGIVFIPIPALDTYAFVHIMDARLWRRIPTDVQKEYSGPFLKDIVNRMAEKQGLGSKENNNADI